MTTIIAKRIEVIADRVILDKLIENLAKAGFKYYTVFPDVRGNGDRGLRAADGVVGASRNFVMVLYVCEWQVEDAGEVITPLLTRYGGIATVEDADILYAKHLCHLKPPKKEA